jgi:hypothetical protein
LLASTLIDGGLLLRVRVVECFAAMATARHVPASAAMGEPVAIDFDKSGRRCEAGVANGQKYFLKCTRLL